MQYLIAYDFGTTGVKTCLFGAEQDIRLIASAYAGYGLYILPDGGAEQDADEWWDAMCRTTKAVFEKTDVTPAQVTGISFCSQMQGMVLVDEYGRALRRPMSYMDQRASAEFKACQTHGPCVSGVNIGMLLRSLRATHAASTSVKDPLWKYKWVQAHEPEIFQEAHKWLDVKESLIARATGEFVMTRDSAYSTFLYDTRPGREGWNEELCRMYGVETRHLAKIIECTDVAGLLTEQAARELGLCPGTRVYGGGGALSKVTCQMLADITGRTVETVENTKDVGAIGAAMLAAVGSGLFPDLTQAASHVKVNGRYTPNTALKPVYDRNYRVFRQLHASNKKNFALLNRLKEG